MDRLELLKAGTGQTITFKPIQGRASATPTVAIIDNNGSVLTAAADTNVTLDAVNTTVSVEASAGDIGATLTAVTNVAVGKTYILTNTLGQSEQVRVIGIDTSGKIAYFDEPLERNYALTSTFAGFWFVYAVQTADVASLDDNKRARALYTVGGVQYTLDIAFDVCLTPLQNVLTVEFVKKHRPDIMAQEHSETLGSDFADLREAAFNRVRRGIRSHATGWRPALLKTPDDIEEWALLEFDLLCQRNGVRVLHGFEPRDAVEYLDNKLSEVRHRALSSLDFMDLNDDDAQATKESRPLKMDLIR